MSSSSGHFTGVKLKNSRFFAYCCLRVSAWNLHSTGVKLRKWRFFSLTHLQTKSLRISFLRGEKCKVRCENDGDASSKTFDFLIFTPVSCRWPCFAYLTVRALFHHILNTFQSKTLLISRVPLLSLHSPTSVFSVSYHETNQNRLPNGSLFDT